MSTTTLPSQGSFSLRNLNPSPGPSRGQHQLINSKFELLDETKDLRIVTVLFGMRKTSARELKSIKAQNTPNRWSVVSPA
jgi:hypothetical protein